MDSKKIVKHPTKTLTAYKWTIHGEITNDS